MARPRSEEAREKMLRAAAEIVFEDGVNAVTIDEVSRRSGVAKTTLYRHFETKNAMLVCALDGATAFPELPDTGTVRQDLIEFFEQLMPMFDDLDMRAVALDLMAAATRDPELDALHRRSIEDRIGLMRTIFERAQRRGELPDDLDYLDAFDFLEGPFMVRTLLYPEKVKDIDIERTVDRIIGALQA